jgi:regulator of cell morphogenesis and NO signaling
LALLNLKLKVVARYVLAFTALVISLLNEKLMIMEKEAKETTVAEIVADDYRSAEIFKRHGIDFCCGGRKKLNVVCSEKHVDVHTVEHEISLLQTKPIDREHNFNEWGLSFLIDYIVQVHHTYIIQNVALTSEFADKVAKVHGHHNTETIEINRIWKKVALELSAHLKKEEAVLFPYIKNLDEFYRIRLSSIHGPHLSAVKGPVNMMEAEHEEVGGLMQDIRKLSNNFTPPDYACNTYKVLYAKLKEFEEDLHQHIHLENNILFPKAIQLEKIVCEAN